jgi:hypothetical protein
VIAAPFELENIETHVRALREGTPEQPLQLGSLAVAWPAVSRATTVAEVRRSLARTAWGDPGGDTPADFAVGVRLALARRVALRIPAAREWAHGAVAVLVARGTVVTGVPFGDGWARTVDRLLGRDWREARSITELAASLPASAAWVLAGIDHPDDLWEAELAVVGRVAADARRLSASSRYAESTAVGVMVSMLIDLWRVRAAIEVAARQPIPMEVFDAVA